MVCPNNTQITQRLETLYQKSPSVPVHQQFGTFLRQIGEAIVHELTRDRNEPRFSKFHTIDGQVFWRVYDPVTGRTLKTDSELEVREWLDQRYSS